MRGGQVNDIDAVFEQFTVDVPTRPAVDELRGRVHQRHRRPASMAVLIAALLIAAGTATFFTDRPREDALAGGETTTTALPVGEFRNVELVIASAANATFDFRLVSPSITNWIGTDPFAPTEGLLKYTTRTDQLVRVKGPTWSRGVTSDGRAYVGNEWCKADPCHRPKPLLDLRPGDRLTYDHLYLDVFVVPLGTYRFTDRIFYEVPSTGESGVVPIDVTLRITESIPGVTPGGPEPVEPTPSTATLPPPPPPPTN
jgi:hypothetical protein